MNRLMTRSLAMAFTLFGMAGLLQAQTDGQNDAQSNFPVVPMTVRVQFVPQYFAQLIRQDQRYGSIEALIDNDSQWPWYEVLSSFTRFTLGVRAIMATATGGSTGVRITWLRFPN